MENWLAIAVGIYLVSMVLYGHYRGFLRLAVSMGALIVTLVVVNIAMPRVTSFLKQNSTIHQFVEDSMKDALGLTDTEDEATQLPSVQRTVIEGLDLPEPLKKALIENNNSEVYEMLGVNAFTEYVGTYITNVIINMIGFIVLFGLVFVLIHVVMAWADILARLPIINGLNKIAGALLGGLQGLIFFWIICLAVTIFSGTTLGSMLVSQIESSVWLSYLYTHNLLSDIMIGLIYSMF